MPILPSNYTIPTITRTPYLERYPSSHLLNGYNVSPASSSHTIPSLYSERRFSPRLPPSVPPSQHVRRYTPTNRPYTAGLDVPSERKPVMFHTRPLKTLTVVPSETPERSMTRSPSPTPSTYSIRSNSSLRSAKSSSCCPPPRRVFPQTYDEGDTIELDGKEDSPVVFDANLTLVLGYKGKVRQNVKPIPAHQEAQTASNALSNKISNFLERTDHVMEEWKSLGHKEDEQHSLRMKKSGGKFLGRSRSATNIMIKGFQYFSRASSCSRSSVARSTTADVTEEPADDATEAECDEVYLGVTNFNCFCRIHRVLVFQRIMKG